MRRYYKEACFRTLVVRICVVLFALVAPIHIYGVGYTPTDAGLYVNFQKGDQFLLSVWIDRNNNGVEDAGEEFFVCDYPSEQPRTPFNYSGYGNFLKLFTQN